MAKRLNKQMVLILTIASMVLTTVAMVVVIVNLPQRDPQPLAREAEALLKSGNYEEAVKKYQGAARRAKARKEMGLYAEYMNLAGETALKAGWAPDARRCWSDVMLNEPKNERAQQNTVKLLLEYADYNGIPWNVLEREAERLVEINPDNPIGLHALGLALVQQRAGKPSNADEGEKKLKAALVLDKNNADYAEKLAQYYLSVNRLDDAEKTYDQLVKDAEALVGLAAPAASTAPAGASQPAEDTGAESRKRLAKAYLLRGGLLVIKAGRLRADAARAPAAQAGALQTQADQVEARALADLENAVRTAPGSADVLVGLARYWQLKQPTATTEQERQKQGEEFRARARQYYEEAIRSSPQSFEAYQGLARVYMADDQPDKAIAVLKERMDRGYDRKHYLAEVDTMRMISLREDCFKINMTRLFELARQPMTSEARNKARDAIVREMENLCDTTVADTPAGEQNPWALFMRGRLLLVDGNINGAITKLEQAEKTFASPPPELRQTLANLYLQTRAFGPAAEQLERLTRETPLNTAAWLMLAQARLQTHDATRPDRANDLTIALAAAKEALRQEPTNRDGLRILAAIYRQQGNEEAAKAIDSQLAAGLAPEQAKLREAMMVLAQAGDDKGKIAQGESMLREILAKDPLNSYVVGLLIQILADRYATASEADKSRIVTEIEKIIADARAAVQKKLAVATPGTQPAAEQAERERLETTLNVIDRLAIVGDPQLSYEEKAARLRKMIEDHAAELKKTGKSEDPRQVAFQLFDVYRRSDKLTREATEQANAILAMDLEPEHAGIVDMIFLFALKNNDWALAEKCIIPAAKTGLDPADGRLYRGRLLLARSAGPGGNQEDATRARDELRAALRAFPTHSMGQAWLGLACLALRDYGEANRALEEARRLDPQNGLAAVGLGMVAEAQGNQAALNSALDLCAQLAPTHPWVASRLTTRQEQQNPTEAIARREAARKEKPKDLANLMALANLYLRVDKPDEALKIYEECQQLEPANITVADRYSTLLVQRKEFDAAEKVIRKTAQSVDPSNTRDKANAQLLLAMVLANRVKNQYGGIPADQQPVVDQAFIDIAKLSSEPGFIMNIASYFRQTGRLEQTLEWQRKWVDAIAHSGQQLDAQRGPLLEVIETLLTIGDRKRTPEIEKELARFRGLFPQDARYYIYEGRMHAMNGDDARAIEAFTNYIKSEPNDPVGYAHRGQTYFRASRMQEAIKDLQELKRLDPTYRNYLARVMLAQALADPLVGQIEAAISELQSVLSKEPNHRQAVETLVELYELPTVDRRAATDSLLAARMQADPTNPFWLELRVSVAMNRKQPDEAIRYAREAAEKSKQADNELEPARVSLFFNLCLQLGRYDDLLAFAREKLPPSQQSLPVVRLYMGSAYAGKQDATRAIESYLDVLNSDVTDFTTPTNIILSDIRTGRLKAEDSLAILRKRLEAKPDDLGARLVTLLIEKDQGGPRAPVDGLRRFADDIQPDSPKNKALILWIKSQIATTLHLRDHKYEEARNVYEQMLKIDPQYLFALNNLAYLLMTDMNDPQAALPYSEQAARIAPNDGRVLDTLGWNHVLLKNYDDAISRLRQAIQLEPGMSAIHYHAAEAFFRRGTSEGAKDPDGDRESARTEVQKAHGLIRQTGKDPDKIIDDVIELGRKLNLTLERPATMPAAATRP